MKKVVPKKASTTLLYGASIKVLGKIYVSTGATVREAIENLKPSLAKGMSILSISKGEVTKERILNRTQTQALFAPAKLMRELALKNVSAAFDL